MPLYKQECPICEFTFAVDVKGSERIRCSCCNHIFPPSRNDRVADELPAKIPSPLLKNTPPQADQSVAIGKSDNLRSSIMVKRMQAKRRSNIILLLLFVGAVASVAYLVYRFNETEQRRHQQLAEMSGNPMEVTDSPNPTDSVPPEAPPAEPEPAESEFAEPEPPSSAQSGEDANPIVAQSATPAATTTAPAKPTQPPKFQFLTAANGADQAAMIRPYLVLLEIESPMGTRYATGTIVDSRGYVLTSLPAVVDATSIKVSSAQTTSQIERNARSPLSDNIRSIVAVSRSQQWVLLEINRKLVFNTNDILIPATDRIVSRQPLFRVIAPQSPSDYMVSEMRVDSRKKSDDLTTQEKQLLDASALQQGDDVNWIVSPHSPYDRLGAALISTEGKLMAMLVNSDDRFSYFISATEIASRLRENSFEKRPFPVSIGLR